MPEDQALRELGACEIGALRRAVQRLEASGWNDTAAASGGAQGPCGSRQLVTADLSGWPRIDVRRAAGWEPLGALAAPLMQQLVAAHYAPGGIIVAARIARLEAGGECSACQAAPQLACICRLHIPLLHGSGVRVVSGDRYCRPEAGKVYAIDRGLTRTWQNEGRDAYCALQFDYLPPQFLDLVDLAADTANA